MPALDDYEQGERIGSGGFADVYQAVHVPSGNPVALKIGRQDDESLGRIRREIEVQRKLAHANVMRILDWDRENFTWFVTEIAEGNLGELHDRKKLSESEVVRFLEEVLAGLGAAHRRGFVHRDLSPGNILRTRGQWVLADWGYVTDPSASKIGRLTRTGTAGGTFQWAAPEALQDAHRADARSDVYALGKLAAWLLTGKVPGVGTVPELPDVEHWRSYLARLTDADPVERFQSSEEALKALAPVVAAIPAASGADAAASNAVGADPVAVSVGALKRYLVSSEHRIRLFEMMTKVTEETVQRVTVERFSAGRLDQGDALLDRLQAYFEACRPLMHLLFTGCHFGGEEHEDLWITSIQRVADTYKSSGGYTKMNELQRVPALLTMNAAAFGSLLGKRYRNLAAVTVRTLVKREEQEDLPLVQRVSTGHTIDRDLLRSAKRFERRQTPASELMFDYLKELGRSVLVSDAEYEEAFDRFEIILGLLTIDAEGWATGCFAWRRGGIAARVRKEIDTHGGNWGPLSAGLFGGDAERVKKAFQELTAIARRIADGL
jgi:serine/threonine protein kinase